MFFLVGEYMIQNLIMFYGKKVLGYFLVYLQLRCSNSVYTITPSTPLKDGDVLVSQGESFALGFFSLTDSTTNRYVGVWYNKVSIQTVVWVLNRDYPVNGTSGVLSINTDGNLALVDQNLDVLLWSTNVSDTSNSGSALLLDSGNLVLYNDSSKNYVAWQGFDYPTNTMLPDMKLGFDKKTGLNRFLTSWKSTVDPGTGEYAYKLNLSGSPQSFLYKGSEPVWRTGPWDGLRWSGVPEMTRNFLFNVTYINNDNELSGMYSMFNTSIFSMMMVNESGSIGRYTWHDNLGKWVEFWSAPKDQCDNYGMCGAFGNCDPFNSAIDFQCTCLPGYEPKLPRDWYLRDGSAGCVRKRGGQGCGNGDGFVKLERVKVPDTSTLSTRVDESIGMKACEEFCLRNCTCVGYTSSNITKGEGSGCITWHGEMIDVRQFSNGGQDLFIRVDAAELAEYYSSKKKKRLNVKQLVAVIILSLTTVVVLLCLAYWWVRKKKRGRRERTKELLLTPSMTMSLAGSPMEKGVDESGTNTDLPSFALGIIVAATNNFSATNKLGEGGFGSVYKGRLHNGQEVAIKRLSDNSGQGMQEFKNEVTLIAKLQHRNLVRLLGYCIEKQEKILIYEYMPNKGLDLFIFDKDKGQLLDWKKRFKITLGISRGMLYLHQDSRLRIIHRDLKASNVLLDESMNPKISDFGMARIVGGEQMEAATKRIVGTYGYMSPEYAMEGLFSIKSDVFSFGVLLLEIISGRKNSSYYKDDSVNLIGHVWDLWGEGRAMEIVDSSMGKLYDENEVKRCIHIGLLCVQEYAVDRPTMSEVASMLCHDTNMPLPKQPAFIFKHGSFGHKSSSASVGAASVYTETITTVEGR